MACPTEDFILSQTGRSSLAEVKSLELCNLELDYLDPAVFSKMVSLKVLDLSNNHLKEIPRNMELKNLQKLDVAGNFLTSTDFVVQFPSLQELYIEGNNIESSDKYIAATLCPSIVNIDKMKKESFTKMMNRQREIMWPKVEEVWEDLFGTKYRDGIPEVEEESVTKKFLCAIKERQLSASNNFKKFADFLVDMLSEELVIQVQNGDYEPPVKKPRRPKSPVKLPKKKNEELISSPKKLPASPLIADIRSSPRKAAHLASPRKPLSPCHNLSVKRKDTPDKADTQSSSGRGKQATVKKSQITSPPRMQSPRSGKFTSLRHKAMKATLPPVEDYDPVYFMRCHSGGSRNHPDDDPTDDETQVWKAEFEPNIKKSGNSTSIVATCGGNTVCLINCKTGRLMKMMREEGEKFYSLAWSTLKMSNDGRNWLTNILAVSGIKGRVVLVHPDQLTVYADFTVAKPAPKYVGCLMFHPTAPTRLFCGDYRGDIHVWDVGIPSGKDYKTHCQPIMTLRSDATNILTMIWSPTGHLVAGCEGGCFVWKINAQNMKKSERNACSQLLINKEDTDVDGMCLLDDDLVACKLRQHGSIYVCKLSNALRTTRARVPVQASAELEWRKTDECYMNIDARSGLLVSGDDKGDMWLYNTEQLLKNIRAHDDEVVFQPSRVLLWPECDIDHKREQEAKMTDLKEKPEALVVNDVAISEDKEYIVAVLDNNMVAIWQVEQDSESEEDMEH